MIGSLTLSRRTRRYLGQGILIFFALIIMLWVLVPYLWIISNSLRPQEELTRTGVSYLPGKITMKNYLKLFSSTPLARYFLNSLLVGVSSMALSLAVAVPAAYAIARYRFHLREPFLLGILLAYMVPPILLLIPAFTIMRNLHLLNTHISLILMHSSYAAPFSTWLLVGYFDALPPELEDAAQVDGCSRLGALLRVVLPLAIPGVIATAIFALIVSWNEFLYAITFLSTGKMFTLPVGIYNFMGGESIIYWGQITAAGVVTSLPVAIAFILFQRHLIRGLTAGATKG
ncbi:MAG TPA: hypothetical protein DEP84_23965 [Chloroflexi bacterium]|nr:hypothetical protein [Chloroflexota bacterium]